MDLKLNVKQFLSNTHTATGYWFICFGYPLLFLEVNSIYISKMIGHFSFSLEAELVISQPRTDPFVASGCISP